MTLLASAAMLPSSPARADGNVNHVNHFILAMQENHSFDNYFGVLPYVSGSPYHKPTGPHRSRGCVDTDHTCVDGLKCTMTRDNQLICHNHNPGNTTVQVKSFHEVRYCTGPDLDHSWTGSHEEGNFKRLNEMLSRSRNNGFVKVNAATEDPDQAVNHDTMGYYDNTDLPFYYDLAETFSISDRYFCAVIGPTFPNRAYFLAGTSFGHLTTSEILTAGGYKPITGTIFDLLDAAGVTWTDYYSDLPYSAMFHTSSGHTKTIANFAIDAAAGNLPQVSFIDPSVFANQSMNGVNFETDEHPPADVRAGEYMQSQIITALRNSPNWSDSAMFLTYDEHGGFYDHVMPPPAPQGGSSTPDGIDPGQCADASNPPTSEQPGGGANCNFSQTDDAPSACPAFSAAAPYPADCSTFDQLGYRVPLVTISPFSKPHYVSHTVASHASFLALLEKRFSLPSLTARDANASDMEDLFDFDNSPSLNATIGTAPLPAEPPVSPSDPGCPY